MLFGEQESRFHGTCSMISPLISVSFFPSTRDYFRIRHRDLLSDKSPFYSSYFVKEEMSAFIPKDQANRGIILTVFLRGSEADKDVIAINC